MLLLNKKNKLTGKKSSKIEYLFKRFIDRAVASILIILLAPVMLLVAIAIAFDSPGTVIFKQTRVGLNGREFKVWKFRSMVCNSELLQQELECLNEVEGGVIFKMKEDPRVTKVGKLLRRYSIDEIPQLFNVLMGDMSLVGPRPLPLRDVAKMDAWQQIRHEVTPGITGLAQVNGRSHCSSKEFFYWDEIYVKQWSVWLDLKILFETIPVVVTKKGAF